MEALGKALGRELLLSQSIAQRYGHPVLSLGTGFPRRHRKRAKELAPGAMQTISRPPSTTQIANIASK
jgi:hypothetical protein